MLWSKMWVPDVPINIIQLIVQKDLTEDELELLGDKILSFLNCGENPPEGQPEAILLLEDLAKRFYTIKNTWLKIEEYEKRLESFLELKGLQKEKYCKSKPFNDLLEELKKLPYFNEPEAIQLQIEPIKTVSNKEATKLLKESYKDKYGDREEKKWVPSEGDKKYLVDFIYDPTSEMAEDNQQFCHIMMKIELERQLKKKEKKPRTKKPKQPKNVVSQEAPIEEIKEEPISSEELKELNKLIEQSIIENELDLGNPYEIKCYDNDGNFEGIETDLPKHDCNIDFEGLIKSYGSDNIDPEGNYRPNWKEKPTIKTREKMSKVKKQLLETVESLAPTVESQEAPVEKPKKRGKKQDK
jgi:hypothetical protein